MPQIFRPRFNTFARVTALAAPMCAVGVVLVIWLWQYSEFETRVGSAPNQPVAFSHEHHIGGLGIDCRYCHTSVEESAFANIPPTKVCMTCHSQLYTDAQMLELIRESYRQRVPIGMAGRAQPDTDVGVGWNRVHDLPDFVYFDHSIHIAKGVACVECHGQVDEMPLMYKANTLHMQWCLDCHRDPQQHLRPREEVFNMDWQPPADQDLDALRAELAQMYDVNPRGLTNCSVCHR